MAWTNAIVELRTVLSDGDTDKNVWRKRCLGFVNGTNVLFKTFENRRITNFTTASAPFGVFVNGVAATITADDVESGQFTISAAPADGSYLEATYIHRWFIDTELDTFLNNASQWLQYGATYANIADGLQDAAIKYACHQAYQKLAVKFALHLSSTYKMEDVPSPEVKDIQKSYESLSDQYKRWAKESRDEYYSRAGQGLAPNRAYAFGSIRKP